MFGFDLASIMEEITMPNHISQQLSICGADAPKAVKQIAGTESAFDFNRVIPMPQEVNIEEGSDGCMGLAAITGRCDEYLSYGWVRTLGVRTAPEFAAYLERERPHAIDLAKKYLSNQQKFGHATWYGWCNANWGTKWNAYSVAVRVICGEDTDPRCIRYDMRRACIVP